MQQPRGRLPALSAAGALLLSSAQVVWADFFLNDAGDGAAFAMALLGALGVPVCLGTSCTFLLEVADGRMRRWAVGAIGASAMVGGGLMAGFFVADDPGDPLWIGWFADALPVAFVVAASAATAFFWRLFPHLRSAPRIAISVPLGLAGAVTTALVSLQTPTLWLVSVTLVVALVVLRIRSARFAGDGRR